MFAAAAAAARPAAVDGPPVAFGCSALARLAGSPSAGAASAAGRFARGLGAAALPDAAGLGLRSGLVGLEGLTPSRRRMLGFFLAIL